MRRNSNYFGDLSQFFLKAKKEENFVLPNLNPEVKNAIREKISLKINEIKNPFIEQTAEQDARQTAAEPMIPVAKPAYTTPAEAPAYTATTAPAEAPAYTATTAPAAATAPAGTTAATGASFWSLWKRQLISVPASLAALTLIVFAANNFDFSLDRPALKTDLLYEQESIGADLAVQDDTFTDEITMLSEPWLFEEETADLIPEGAENDAPVILDTRVDTRVKKEPELLVLDINAMDTESARTLNKLETAKVLETTAATTTATDTSEATTTATDTSEATTTATGTSEAATTTATGTSEATTTSATGTSEAATTSATGTPEATTTSATGTSEAATTSATDTSATSTDSKTAQPSTGGGPAVSNEPALPGDAALSDKPTEQTQPTQTTQTDLQQISLTVEPIEKTQQLVAEEPLQVTIAPINLDRIVSDKTAILEQQVELKSYVHDANIFIKTVKSSLYSINYYKDASISGEPEFDRTILRAITKNKKPASVNVYYLDAGIVLVEIIEADAKRLYLYELKDGSWTIVKYEKTGL